MKISPVLIDIRDKIIRNAIRLYDGQTWTFADDIQVVQIEGKFVESQVSIADGLIKGTHMAKLGECTIVKDCVICRREVILLATRDSRHPLPEKDTLYVNQVCDECREKYLVNGVLLVNPDNGCLVVLKDEAFSRIFDQPIPAGKICFAEQKVLDYLNEANASTQISPNGD